MTAPARILFVVPGRLDIRTGGYGYLRRMIAGLRDRGQAVDVVEMTGRFPDPDAMARRAAAVVAATASTADSTVIVIDGLALPAFDDVLTALAARHAVLALIHHPLADETGLTPDAATALRRRETRQLALVHGVLCSSRFTAGQLHRDYGMPAPALCCIPPGTDPAPATRLRRGGRLRLLCVASLTPRKAHPVLLHALARLRRQGWSLDLVGSPALDPAAARRVTEIRRAHSLQRRVRLRGIVSDATLDRLWRRADLHVLPSWHEGYGMAHAEALRRGLPLIAGDGGATAGTVPPGTGILVPPGNGHALAKALRSLLGGLRARRRLAARARWAGRQLAPWPVAVADFAAAIDRLVGTTGPAIAPNH